MSFINVMFPLKRSGKNIGFDSYKNDEIADAVKFNLKNIILTNPGERIWDMSFGAGIRSMLFENITNSVLERYRDIILGQLEAYAPYIEMESIDLYEVADSTIKIDLKYSINKTNIIDVLEIEINSDLIWLFI